jgi:hypothetical protein
VHQLEQRLLALAEDQVVGLRRQQAELRHRRDVLAAQHHRHAGPGGLDGVDQPDDGRPLVREDHRDADQAGVGGDALGHLVGRQPDEVPAEVAQVLVGRLGDGVDDADVVAGGLERPGDVRQPQRWRDGQAREPERLDRRWADQADRALRRVDHC